MLLDPLLSIATKWLYEMVNVPKTQPCLENDDSKMHFFYFQQRKLSWFGFMTEVLFGEDIHSNNASD